MLLNAFAPFSGEGLESNGTLRLLHVRSLSSGVDSHSRTDIVGPTLTGDQTAYHHPDGSAGTPALPPCIAVAHRSVVGVIHDSREKRFGKSRVD